MDAFNRALAAVVVGITAVALTVVVLTTAGLAIPASVHLGPWLQDGVQRVAQLSGSARWVWGFGALAGLAASLILLAWELRGLRRREPSLVLHEGQTGVVTVAVDMVRRLAEREAGTVPGVYASHCSVRDGRLGLRVRCALDLDLDAEVPSVSEKVQRRVKESLERQLGFVVEVVAVHSSAPGGRGLSRGRIR